MKKIFLLFALVGMNVSVALAAPSGCTYVTLPCPEMVGACPPGQEWFEIIGIPHDGCRNYSCRCGTACLDCPGQVFVSFTGIDGIKSVTSTGGQVIQNFTVGQTFNLQNMSHYETILGVTPASELRNFGAKSLTIVNEN